MGTRNTELIALVEELMDVRRLSRAEAMLEAERTLAELVVEAQAWDYAVDTAQAELRRYESAWNAMSDELRGRARRSRRQLAA